MSSQDSIRFKQRLPAVRYVLLAPLMLTVMAGCLGADEPYAPSRDYELQNVHTHLWFDVAQRAERGEVVESVATLREGVSQLKFDSVDLQIKDVLVDGKNAEFSVTPKELVVKLDHPASVGERHEISIRYEGEPKRGLYFILPSKDEPDQPAEIWTQGEAEDTRYYIPLYDYPNDRTTSEMLLTVPAKWTTVSNGQLVSVKNEPDGTKTWDWKQSEPLSTYLISAIAGDFVEREDSWHGVALRYAVPRGEETKIEPTFGRTKEMLELFSRKLDMPYPWPQYAQTAVDDFTAGGMENTSATTVSTRDLVHPALAPELRIGDDIVVSHELAHQWFGDLVTCKDWANLWLNEGFATFFQNYWLEQHYGADEAEYSLWRDENRWFAQKRLYKVPMLTRDFDDSTKYAGNVYDKAGWILEMLRAQLGDDNFFHALHEYLVTNRGKNVVTADLQKAIERATSTNVDRFFDQWIYGAGAPEFVVGYNYDAPARSVTLNVAQTQKAEGSVGVFDVPITVEIATASGPRTYPLEINQANQTFHFPVDGPPLMVIFDKGDKVLKSLDFIRDPALLIYQLKHAETAPDRAEAASALASVRGNSDVITALGEAAQHDPFWGIRVEALRSLGKLGGPDAKNAVLAGLNDEKPWVREGAVRSLLAFKDDPAIATKLATIAASDPAYRIRALALSTLAEVKASNAFDILTAAVNSDSPDGILRDAALGGFGTLGDDRAIPILMTWSALGKPIESREQAIEAMAELNKRDEKITETLVSFLHDPHYDVRTTVIIMLGVRGDASAASALEKIRNENGTTPDQRRYIDSALSILKAQSSGR